MKVRRQIRAAAVVLAAVMGVTLMGAATPAHAQSYDGKVVSKTNLAVRKLPTTASAKVGSLKPGQTIPIECKVKGTPVDGNPWWYALPPTLNEWVSARYIENVGPAPRLCGSGELAKGKVTTSKLKMRTGPTTKASSAGTLSKGQEINLVCKLEGQVVDGNPRWYHLKNGKWVAARYVKNVGAAPSWCN